MKNKNKVLHVRTIKIRRNECRAKSYLILKYIINNKIMLIFTGFGHSEFKRNFLRMRRMVLIGGPDDGLICPWQSRFGHHLVLYTY